MSSVAISTHSDVEQGIVETLDALPGADSMLRGRHVAIKPNETWAAPHDLTACTQADTLRALIRYVKRHNPSAITVTGGCGAGETEEIFSLLGMDDVIREEAVGFVDHNRGPFMPLRLTCGPQEQILVNPAVFSYGTLISLAQLKVHDSAGVTLTMKNVAMSLPAADYYGHPRRTQRNPHRFFEDLHGFIVGVCRHCPIDLGIIVGHPAMVGSGPIGGTTFEADLTIASLDCVAADAVGAHVLGRTHVEHIQRASLMGLGRSTIERINIVGTPLDAAVTHFAQRQAQTMPAV